MSLGALLANHDQDVSSVLIPDYIKEAPKEVRNRICALKKLHMKNIEIRTEFNKRVHALETEFRARYDEVNKQREAIVNGKHEPNAAECDFKLFSWMEDEQDKKFKEATQPVGDQKGIPNFWFNVLIANPTVNDFITKADEPILHHLTDITVEQSNEPPAFTLNFHFSENDYFTNAVLSKSYTLSIGPNGFEDEIFYDSPTIVSTKGCSISWKNGKDITKKSTKKKDNPAFGPVDSFFCLFTPEFEKIDEDLPEESAELLNADFELGQEIRDSVIDNAVLYYTGELDDDDYEDSEDEADYMEGINESGDDSS